VSTTLDAPLTPTMPDPSLAPSGPPVVDPTGADDGPWSLDALGVLVEAATADVAALDPSVLTGPQSAARVERYARLERIAAAGRLACLPRVQETHAWEGQGHASCADWTSAVTGCSVNEAHRDLTTARRLSDLPATTAGVRAGQLSAAQASAIADAAAADPVAEERLLALAKRETFKGLRDECQRTRAAATDSEERRKRIRAERSFRTWVDPEGAGCISIRGPASDLAKVLAAMKPTQEARFRAKRTDVNDTYENRTYDSFMDIIEHALDPDSWTEPDGGDVGEAGRSAEASVARRPDGSDAGAHARAGEPTVEPPLFADVEADRAPPPTQSTPDSTGPGRRRKKKRRPGGANTKVIVLIDHTALQRGHAEPGETCEIAGIGAVSVADVDEILANGDPFLAAVIKKGRDIVNVAHLGRGVSVHQRTALEATRIECSNIACNRTVSIEIDHRKPWTTEQITELGNQDPLCKQDHRRKTHHGWTLEPGSGRRRFLPPDQSDPNDPDPPEGPPLD
jgi:hypothetical protein